MAILHGVCNTLLARKCAGCARAGETLICSDTKRQNAVYETAWIKQKNLHDSASSQHQLSANADGGPRFAVFLFEQRLELNVQDTINILFHLNEAVLACLCAGSLQFLGFSFLHSWSTFTSCLHRQSISTGCAGSLQCFKAAHTFWHNCHISSPDQDLCSVGIKGNDLLGQ